MIKIKKFSSDAIIPKRAHTGDSGLDLYSCEKVTLQPGETKSISTGIGMSVYCGYEIQVRPRSGVSKRGILIHFGTVDSSYKGPIHIIVTNLKKDPHTVDKGDRIAQAVIAPIFNGSCEIVDDLGESTRGENGFGSTGLR